MKIQNKTKEWQICPEFNGLGRIVDFTEPKDVTTEFGVKKMFRVVVEVDEEMEDDKGKFTVSTRPFTMSLHEKSNLYKFLVAVTGLKNFGEEFDMESIVGKFVNLIVEHVEVEGKTYANISYVKLAKAAPGDWTSQYVRRSNRDKNVVAPVDQTASDAEAEAEFEKLLGTNSK